MTDEKSDTKLLTGDERGLSSWYLDGSTAFGYPSPSLSLGIDSI